MTKEYRNGALPVRVLNGIEFSVDAGAVATIVGASGAGKSTLLHILGTLDRPTSGAVCYCDENVYAASDARRAELRNRTLGFVFQFYHLMPELTAIENILLPSLIARAADGAARLWARELLDAIGLADRGTHFPNQLSGGEQQRIAIARALMNRPRIVFADEPTGNLDSANSAGIIRLLLDLQQRYGYTLVIVTHDMDIAAFGTCRWRLADGILNASTTAAN